MMLMYLQKENNKKKIMKATIRAGYGYVSQLYSFADPDPYQNVTDQQHCRE